jgi:hypothetical protein
MEHIAFQKKNSHLLVSSLNRSGWLAKSGEGFRADRIPATNVKKTSSTDARTILLAVENSMIPRCPKAKNSHPLVLDTVRALGVEPIPLLYFTDRHYNPADELRIAYNDPAIAYDWETQHK